MIEDSEKRRSSGPNFLERFKLHPQIGWLALVINYNTIIFMQSTSTSSPHQKNIQKFSTVENCHIRNVG